MSGNLGQLERNGVGIKISVVTATWNCEDTVEDCLRSISRQSWNNKEHVVVDGVSRDKTLMMLERHRPCIDVLVSEPDRGIYDALNKGISRSSGDVIGFLHADDIYGDSDVLRRVAEAFADPDVSAVYGDLQYVRKDDTSQVVRHWKSCPFSRTRLAWGWMERRENERN